MAAGRARSATAAAAAGGRSGAAPPPCTTPCPRPWGSRGSSPCRTGRGRAPACTSGERQSVHRAAGREHLLQHPRPAAGGVLLLPRGRVGRAHHPAGRREVGAALAHAGAAVDRRGEVAPVVRVGQGQVPPVRRDGGDPHVGVQRGRAHEHAGVEQVLGVEQALDPLEQRDRVGGVHRRQQLAAGPAVAVLTRQRAAVAGHQPRRRPRRRRGRRRGRRRPATGRRWPNGKSIRTCTQPSPKCP